MLNSLLLRYPMPTFRKQIKSSTVNYDFRFQLDSNDKRVKSSMTMKIRVTCLN